MKQISVFLENKEGRLFEVCDLLGKNNLNIRALSVADTADFGIVRMIVEDHGRAYQALKEAGFTVALTEVIAVEVPDEPGGLARVLEVLKDAKINVEYLYCFVGRSSNRAIDIMRVEKIEEATRILVEKGFNLLTDKDISSI